MSDKAPMIRLATQIVASVGVSKVVSDVIRNNTTVQTTADAVKVWAGSVVVGSMIAEHASAHVNRRFDEVMAWRKSRETTTPAE